MSVVFGFRVTDDETGGFLASAPSIVEWSAEESTPSNASSSVTLVGRGSPSRILPGHESSRALIVESESHGVERRRIRARRSRLRGSGE